MECTKVNCPMQAGTKTDNCGENCQWRTTAKTGDLISRAAAISEIDEYLQGLDSCISDPDLKLDGYRNGLQVAIQELTALPTVDAMPVVHGRWVYEHGDPMSLPCSVCGYQVYRYNNTHYCPNCGAKMDGE